ncbi:hypothetical protein ASE85_12920 [Sphingobium sp. Leaf26]|nr:hypothetical protein ASE85_12920 [Sphingobium sp. Leaf26]
MSQSVKVGLRQWGLRLSTILWFLGGLAFLFSLPLVVQASPLILLGILLIALSCAAVIASLIERFLRTSHFRTRWLKASVAMIFLLTIIVASPIYYAATITQVSPAMVPQATLSDGRKTIIFQGMQHVATEVFFKSVIYDLEDELSRGSVAYYEGVKPSNSQDDRWFDTMITGGADLGASYRALGDMCGLQFQGRYFGLLGRDVREHPAAHVVADVTTAQLRAEYGRLMQTDPAFAAAMKEKADARRADEGDGLEKIVSFLRRGSEGQRKIAGILCRGFMTYGMRRGGIGKSEDQMNKLILDYRNHVLAAALLAEPRQRIYVTYGAEHLSGVLALMRNTNPRWRIVSVTWTRTIDSPEQLVGKL